MPYCSTSDLLTGNIPTPAYLDADKFIGDAADEIDSKIGFVYLTPIDVADSSSTVRPARLLLKRLNVFIATGRLLMAADANGEDKTVHAYALRLLTEAAATLDMISKGQIDLDGAAKVEIPDSAPPGPVIGNKDTESQVDAFYDRIGNPNYLYLPDLSIPYPGAPSNGGLVR